MLQKLVVNFGFPDDRFAVTAIEREFEMLVIHFILQTMISIPLKCFTNASNQNKGDTCTFLNKYKNVQMFSVTEYIKILFLGMISIIFIFACFSSFFFGVCKCAQNWALYYG